jgi:hypothetical protein
MISSELVAALARENPGLRMEEVEKIVSTFFDEISAKLAAAAASNCAASAPSRPASAILARAATRAPAKRSTCRASASPISSPARKCAPASTLIEQGVLRLMAGWKPHPAFPDAAGMDIPAASPY